ncbi:MAG: hypothetical protein ACHQEB_03360 [Chitinophagales bacterium]
MNLPNQPTVPAWPFWQKILFRFFFIFLLLLIAPWTWLDEIPGVEKVTRYYYQLMDWAVNTANANLFHVRKVLVPLNGSGDTSYGWAQLWLFLSLAFVGCLIWSVVDRKRNSYKQLDYWTCLFTRYSVAFIAFSYGILKLFALQMPFPSQSMMATPLGDLLPMRLSWMFIGYSQHYQVFSGVMETMVGVLLLFRRSVTFGVMVATTVFIHVMVLNLCYDIPVKIFSMEIVLMCLVLLAHQYKRILAFFILNKPAAACSIYNVSFSKKWMRITRIVLKSGFIILAVGMRFYNYTDYYKSVTGKKESKPIKAGMYDVSVYAVNSDTIPPLLTDTLRWQDVIFEKGGFASMKTSDTSFRHIYKRAYFNYYPDTIKKTISFETFSASGKNVFSFRYELPDSNTIRLWGKTKNDSLYVELKKSNRHFQLAERQFHWLSEYNR